MQRGSPNRDLPEIEDLGAVKVLHLTGRGQDVAKGRVVVRA